MHTMFDGAGPPPLSHKMRKLRPKLITDEKILGHSEKNIFNKHFQGTNSELNLYIFQGKHPEFRRMAEFRKKSFECYGPSFPLLNSDHGEFEPPVQKYCKSVEKRKLRPWSDFPPRQNSDHGPS